MPYVQLQFRRGTASEWSTANNILAVGEMGIETDTKLFKIGDGNTYWNNLQYGGIKGSQGFQGPSGGAQGAQGRQGFQGAQGAGFQGAQGAGFQGAQGFQGSIGNQGNNGNQGFQGPSGGAQGAQGAQGSIGLGFSGLTSTSQYTISSGLIGGILSFTTNLNASQTAFAVGSRIIVTPTSATGSYILGVVTNFSGTNLNLYVDIISTAEGAGPFTQWGITLTGSIGAQGFQGAQGRQGFQGAQGAGFQGAQGAGFQGAQGFQGANGGGGSNTKSIIYSMVFGS
jgi:hypothetical protein